MTLLLVETNAFLLFKLKTVFVFSHKTLFLFKHEALPLLPNKSVCLFTHTYYTKAVQWDSSGGDQAVRCQV